MTDSIHADSIDTVPISARRFEPSPFFDCYRTEETVFGVYAGRFHAVYNGEDATEAYWALRRRAALFDVPERPVEISGPDASAFLERIFSRRVADLKEGRGRYAIACTPAGGIFMDGILFRLADDRFWYVQADGPLESWFAANADGFDISVTDPRSRVLQLQGPNAPAIMNAASGGRIDERVKYFHAGFFDLGGQRLYVSRTGWTGELGYEIYTLGTETDCRRLWDHLFQAGGDHGLIFSSQRAMEIRRIEAGILDNRTDMDMTMTPFQAGLGTFVDLDKPDFVGREALRGADRQKLLYGLTCKSATPGYRCAVLSGDSIVGRVTAGARSPFLECGVGYVRFDEPGDWTGRELVLRSRDGGSHASMIVDLPFYDPEKRIPRGLESAIP